MSNDPNEAFSLLCNSLRREGGKHSGKTSVIAIAYDGDMSIVMESMAGKTEADRDLSWHDTLRIVVNRYLDVWAGDDFDRERAITSLEDDIASFIAEYREENGMEGECEA